jgi:hydroxymethylpyrimidine pyrophosphatase-like HAD family hydrolase
MDNKVFDEQLEKGEIYKVMVFYGFGKSKNELSKEINRFLREKFPTIESSWSSIVNELTPVDCHKGAGLEYYAKHLGLESNDIIVVGDSGNDITMFNKFHENSYAMTHAHASVKKYAKHTVKKIYKLKEKILEGEKHESK